MSSSLGDPVPRLRASEATNSSFSGELVLSLMTLLRSGLVQALQPHVHSDATGNNPLLMQPNLLRELRFYQTGLAQLNLLAKSERSKIAFLCLDMMPGLLYHSAASPDYDISNDSFTYVRLLATLGLKGPHETIQVRSPLFFSLLLPPTCSSDVLTPITV